MAHFEFLQISWDYGKDFSYCEDESWEQALKAHLYKLNNDWLYSLMDIFRVSNGKIVSCRNEIDSEISRREEEERLEKLEKAQAKERALYEKLAAKFAPKV